MRGLPFFKRILVTHTGTAIPALYLLSHPLIFINFCENNLISYSGRENMSLAEVSKSIGELAAAITRKHQELDTLKEDYEKKIQLLESYFSHLDQNNNKSQDAQEFLDSIDNLKGPVTCPHCSTTLFDIQQETDFVVIPKNRLKPMNFQSHKSNDKDKSGELTQNLEALSLQKPPGAYKDLKHSNNSTSSKSKRTCSYCHKSGHSRARCFARLTREPQNTAESS